MKDYYKILGLDKSASQDDIKKKFKELAVEYHPDVSIYERTHDIFVEINEAYQILSDLEQKSYYDSHLNKEIEKVNDCINAEFESFKSSARQKAQEYAKKDYRSYIKDLSCFYTEQKRADGIPFNYYMHKTTGIKGGVGPMGSIKSKSAYIPIPRSKKATITHRLGFYIKLIFFISSVIVFKIAFPMKDSVLIKLLFSSLIILTGGLIVIILYKVNGVKSKNIYSKNFRVIKKYKTKGFQRGFHPIISTTPIGLIIYMIRWIL